MSSMLGALHLLLAGLIAVALVRPVAVKTEAPLGEIYLEEIFVAKSIEDTMGNDKGPTKKTFVLTCSTVSKAGRKVLKDIKIGEKVTLDEPAHINLLGFEEMECELRETLKIAEQQQQLPHGQCLYSYGRFLSSIDNSVECRLLGGSYFKLKMKCDGGCPKAPEPRTEPYCKGETLLPPSNNGITTSFGDGSPGFSLYSPDTNCSWKIPRSGNGVTNFLFTRFDIANGDKVRVYKSEDGEKRHLIKTYEEHSTPESVSTDAPFLIIEFISDDYEEGLGFYGFYYDTVQKSDPVTIVPHKKDERDLDFDGKSGPDGGTLG